MVMVFSVGDYLLQITAAVAEDNTSIFVLSSYSTDFILVKEECAAGSAEKLKSIGF